MFIHKITIYRSEYYFLTLYPKFQLTVKVKYLFSLKFWFFSLSSLGMEGCLHLSLNKIWLDDNSQNWSKLVLEKQNLNSFYYPFMGNILKPIHHCPSWDPFIFIFGDQKWKVWSILNINKVPMRWNESM